ncbi:flavin-containing monooxygenase 9 [Echria macrotheca]|uniref:Flavin-containing monooxygenase 9 n=1 Tax=Echria macrotheca TaxID=438768 RepID=A0AAJ0B9L6_9PEZI|nr:flavin-containing monooxygenase 9 [Echria macrotheca]
MDRRRVAVIGAGPSGLTMLKTLLEDGFDATLYERRQQVGGLWAYSDNPQHTTALPVTRANISKYTCGFSDFPMLDKYPDHLLPGQFQEYMQDYAKHFGLLEHIVLGADVQSVRRNVADTAWLLEYDKDDVQQTVEIDRIAFCHGYQTRAKIPSFEGQELFEGTIMHSQAYRDPTQFKDKNVVVVGLSSTAGDVIPNLVPHAAKVYVSHRRGAIPVKRYRNGYPGELLVTYRRRQYSQTLQKHFPRLHKRLADFAISHLARQMVGPLDPAWHLEPFPSLLVTLPGVFELVLPLLRDGTVTSLRGLTRFTGPRSVEFADGTVLDNIDAVVLCTGYEADWAPVGAVVETDTVPPVKGYAGPPLRRLWMNLFPPAYADSCVMLCYSAFGKNNGFSFGDVTAQAVSNVWRGVERVPDREAMERQVDAHHAWVARQWLEDEHVDPSMVRQWEFQGWLHEAAGTGLDKYLGWFSWEAWKFWWRDRELYNMMAHGPETAHAFRFFDTGKRRTWEGARDAIVHVNEVVRSRFPVKEEDEDYPTIAGVPTRK